MADARCHVWAQTMPAEMPPFAVPGLVSVHGDLLDIMQWTEHECCIARFEALQEMHPKQEELDMYDWGGGGS